jgi:hypothetical protein
MYISEINRMYMIVLRIYWEGICINNRGMVNLETKSL